MTVMQDASQMAQPLEREFAQRGMTLVEAPEPPPIAGALSSSTFERVGDIDGAGSITVAVAASAGDEVFDLVLAATQAAHPDLAPGSPTSVGSVNELTASTPAALFSVAMDGAPIGVVIAQSDRRQAPQPTSNGASSAPQQAPAPQRTGAGDLTMLRDVVLDVSVELGRDSLTLAQMLNLTIGSVVELDRAAGSPVDIRVNGVLFGRGEVVVVDEEYAVRIVEIIESSGH